MPYEMRKQGDKYCVFNKDTGDNKGCSDTREMGLKHMRALFANAGGEKALACSCDVCLAIDSLDLLDAPTTKELDSESIVQRVIEGIKSWFTEDRLPESRSVVSFKQADGRTRVLMRVSNIFKDRHGEIITSGAHKEYENYVEQSGDYPEFRLWHVPGTRWGQADLVDFSDGFLTVSGLADPGKEYIAYGLAEQKDIGVSHGFKGITLKDKGYIDFYRTFEVSPLPRSEAANVWTAYTIAKEWGEKVGLTDKHKKFFEALKVPGEQITAWDTQSKTLSDILKEAGVDYKEFEDAVDGKKQSRAAHAAMATFHTQAVAAMDAEDKKEPPEKPGEKPDAEDKAEGPEKKEFGLILEAIKALGTRIDGIETTTKALDTKMQDSVASTLEAAIVSGRGFVASKEGSAPSDQEQQSNKKWEEELAELIIGKGN